jgi:3-deoxy-D-manno-octulosonic-acid transferase|tara:strand:+ start:3517 stop:4740 length:1224 start_codon:yes stop_codon:yes gene_type:complete
MSLFYNISIHLYFFAIRVASLFNPKAKEWLEGRKLKNWKNLDTKGRRVVWFHCASLGEFDQGLPLMDAWKSKYPNDFLLVTFFSPSGMKNYHKRKHCADAVCYLPLDTPKNAKEFVKSVEAKNVFFVKYEFWANHLSEVNKTDAKVYSVSAIFRQNQIYFKWYGSFYRSILKNFDHIFLQDENSKKLLDGIGVRNTTVCGDLRFDRVFQNKQKAVSNEILERFVKGQNAMIIGSSWPEDENCIKELINQDSFTKKVIFAPHEVNDKHVKQIEQLLVKKSIRYTDIQDDKSDFEDYQVLILDTIGHLTNAYQYGDLAYVGGGFSGSLHNILEPAAFGLPILFGPKHVKFPEADIFIQEGFAFEIESGHELVEKFKYVEKDISSIKNKLLIFMEDQTGIAEKIMVQLLS